jgi:Mor family transcriptional regulator
LGSTTTSLTRAAHLGSEYRKIIESGDKVRAKRDEAIWQAFNAGYSMREIARSVGLSHQGVLNVVRARKVQEAEKGG